MSFDSYVSSFSWLARYRHGEASGTTLVDSSGNGRDGSYYGGVTLGATGLVTGDSDTAFSTDGSNVTGASQSGVSAWLPTSGFTIFVAVKFAAVSSNKGIVARYGNSSSTQSFLIWLDTSTRIAARFYNSGGSQANISRTGAPSTGVRYVIAASYSSGSMKLYVKEGTSPAAQIGSTVTSLTGNLRDGDSDIRIGEYRTTQSFPVTGTFDETMIAAGQMSDADVLAIMDAYEDGGPATSINASFAATDGAESLAVAVAPVVDVVVAASDGAESLTVAADALVDVTVTGADEPESLAVTVDPVELGSESVSFDATDAAESLSVDVAPVVGVAVTATDEPETLTVDVEPILDVLDASFAATDADESLAVTVDTSAGTPIDLDSATFPGGGASVIGGEIVPDGTTDPAFIFTSLGPVDPDTTYTVVVSYEGAEAAGTFELYSLLTPDVDGFNDSAWHSLASEGYASGLGTVTLTIGPGLGSWAAAMADLERYLVFTYFADTPGTDLPTITSITVDPALPLVPPGDVDAGGILSPDESAEVVDGNLAPVGDGTATVVLANAGPFDAATTYTITVDYTGADSGTLSVFSLLDPSPEGWGASERHVLATPTVTDGDGTLTFDIGPSLAAWADAVADGEFYLGLSFSGLTITSITSTPDLEAIVPDDEEDVEPTEPPATAIVPVLRDVAFAFSDVTVTDGRPSYELASYDVARQVDQIVVDGQDVTWYGRDLSPLPTPDFELIAPGDYGPGSWVLEGLNLYLMEPPTWLREQARVRVNRRDPDTGAWVATDYRGFIRDIIPRGNDTHIVLGGELSGRAALQHRPASPWTRVRDGGFMLADAVTAAGCKHYPRAGVETGVELIPVGGGDLWAHITETAAQMQKRSGEAWTLTRIDGAYQTVLKDRTTIHGTWYTDGTGVNMATSLAEKPNRVFVRAIDDEGRVHNGLVVPGANPDPTVPDFPGTLSLGDSGDAVRILAGKLAAVGLLTRADLFDEDGADTFDDDLEDAVIRLQQRAGLVGSPIGVVDEPTWNAAWDLSVVRPTLDQTRILPLAWDPRTEKWLRTADGTIYARNPDYDPDVMPVEVHKDFGLVKGRRQAVRWAEGELASDVEWVGDWQNGPLALGVVEGEHTPGDPVTGILRARDIKPGMNLWAPLFDGGTLFHVVGAQWTRGESVTFTLDTAARDSMEAWEIARRNRESRQASSRWFWKDQRRSRSVQDVQPEWTPQMGRVHYRDLIPGWNTFQVVVGQKGTIERIRARILAPTEFAIAVFAEEVTPGWLDSALVSDPLTVGGDWAYTKANRQALAGKSVLYVSGQDSQPAGYGLGMKYHPETGVPTGDVPDGLFVDHAAVEFSVPIWRPWVWVAMFVPDTISTPSVVLEAGRMFRVSNKAGL